MDHLLCDTACAGPTTGGRTALCRTCDTNCASPLHVVSVTSGLLCCRVQQGDHASTTAFNHCPRGYLPFTGLCQQAVPQLN